MRNIYFLVFINTLACTYDQYSSQQTLRDTNIPIKQDLDLKDMALAIDQMQDIKEMMVDQMMVDQMIVDQMIVDQMIPTADLNWVFIEKGVFQMGPTMADLINEYPQEFPIHQVTIENDFWMTKSEITVAQYRQCVVAGVCTEPLTINGCNWNQSQKDLHPINCIDWRQARVFAHWIGGELPSEAQWEYAGRNRGQDVIFPWGNDDPTCNLLNYDAPCYGSTTEVCALIGYTSQGLCDMAGNVWEFMLDHYHENYDLAPSNEQAWCDTLNCELMEDTQVSIRGGSWGNPYYHGVRVTHRNSSSAFNPEFPNNAGFRVIKYQ